MSDFNTYQWKTHETAIYPKDRDLEYLGLGLVSEAGEVAGKIKKILRDNGGTISETARLELVSELGDVLWYTAQLAWLLQADLNSVAQGNLDKLRSRSARGTLIGSGDNR
ncbi:phage MazG nucleotide pyrophosphatase [Stenotrophomonas virus Jojan60]|nr:phage MazG nucleotide pyrophosphatase [Stenotrophomonas virus Jojan60]